MSGTQVERKQNVILEDIADGIVVNAPSGGLPVTPASGTLPFPVSGSANAGSLPTAPPLSVSGVDAGGLKRHLLTDTNGAQQVVGPLTDAQLRAAAVPVSGSAAAGVAPSLPPLSISGVDGGGLKRHFKTDTDGELLVHAGGYGSINSASFTRPADTTAYAVGDLVANSTTPGSVTPLSVTVARKNGGSGRVLRARLLKAGTSLTNASFRVHLYKAVPTVSSGDNGAWLTNRAADYLGAFDVNLDRVFTDGSLGTGLPLAGSVITFVTGTSVAVVYALIEARGAYVPISSEIFTLTLEVDSD